MYSEGILSILIPVKLSNDTVSGIWYEENECEEESVTDSSILSSVADHFYLWSNKCQKF